MSARLRMGVVILMALLLQAACSKDSTVDPPDEQRITGDYEGTYQFVQIENGVDIVVDSTRNISMQFGSALYKLSAEVPPDSLSTICDIVGTYELGTDITFLPADSNFTRNVCPPYWGLGGTFSLDMTTDTIRMACDQTDTLDVRRIRILSLVNAD